MLSNHFLLALRLLRRRRGFAALNVAGLAVGLAACLVIGLFVYGEWSYDRFHERADRIVRLVRDQAGDPPRRYAVTPGTSGPALAGSIPAVEASVTMAERTVAALVDGRRFEDERFLVADTAFFDVFSFDLRRGDAGAVLAAPNTVVLTEGAARRYFGDRDPVGETIALGEEETVYRVTGVSGDVPAASHLQFDGVLSFATLAADDAAQLSRAMFWTYLLLAPGTRPADLEGELEAHVARTYGEEARGQVDLALEPLTGLHLHSDAEFTVHEGGSAGAVAALGAIALLVLVLAGINFTNLATAAAADRAREVGVRKTLGAARGGIAVGFLVESVLLVVVAFVVALGLVGLVEPAFTAFTGRALPFEVLLSPSGLAVAGAVVVLVGVLAGAYPAFVLARFRPARALAGTGRPGGGAAFRRGLVVFQFAATIALLAAALVAFRQLDYVYTKDLGFDREHLVSVPVPDARAAERLRTAWDGLPGVTAVTADSKRGEGGAARRVVARPGADSAAVWVDFFYAAEADYADALGLRIAHGRGFEAARSEDAARGVLLNTAATTALGFDRAADAVDAELVFGPVRWRVVGVVEDFHFRSLHQTVEPLLIEWRPEAANRLLVRLRPERAVATLGAMEAAWRTAVPDRPFAYDWMDDLLAGLYADDAVMGRLFAVFAGLAVLVACLGLFGLAAFAAARRTKEIGVRKVLGASVADVVLLLVREYAVLVGVAFVVAVPLAYLGVERWLETFAYRVDVGALPFLAAGVAALLVALLVAGGRAVAAASTDPVRVLRYE